MSMRFISADVYQYIVGSFEIVRGSKAPKLTKNMEFSVILTKTTDISCTSPRIHGITVPKLIYS